MTLRPSKEEIFVSLAGGIYGAFVLPLQVLVANLDLFSVQWLQLAQECIVLFVVLFCILCLLIRLFNGLVKGLGLALALSLFVCFYLESGILSIGLPSINGGLDTFADAWRKLFDAVVWSGVFGLAIIFRKWLSRIVVGGIAAFLIMTCAMIFDAKPVSSEKNGKFIGVEYCSAIDVIKGVEFSPNKNVLFLILDGFPASIAKKLAEENHTFSEYFQGFTAFDNNIGMHSFTAKGVPGLMTGKFQNEFASKESVAAKIYGQDSFLRSYIESGYEIFFSHSFTFPRFATHYPEYEEFMPFPKCSVFPALQTYSDSIPYINLIETMLFRIVPYACKVKVLSRVVRRLKLNTSLGKVKQERFVYDQLSQASISTNSRPTFVSFHTTGVHEPIGRDRKGEPVKDSRLVQNPRGVADQGYFVLEQVSKFMRSLQTKGIYDKAFIVVVADHGTILMKDESGNHGAESALLWVKPVGAKGELAHSDLATSHCKIAEMMRRVAKEDLTIEDVMNILHTKERHFVATKGHAHWWTLAQYYEWVYDESGRIISCKKKEME